MDSFAAINAGIAPLLEHGWSAAEKVLADDQWHNHPTMIEAMVEAGLAYGTADNLLREARQQARVEWKTSTLLHPRNRYARTNYWYRRVR